MTNTTLTLRPVIELLGEQFYIPHYQRGYRWTAKQVTQLLDDLDNFTSVAVSGTDKKTFYCLQPVVVKECNEDFKAYKNLNGKWYEVIDGQQRLTTISLIIHYANEMWIGKQKTPEPTIAYETRLGSSTFLKSLSVDETEKVSISKENLDFYYMSKAYETINDWVNSYSANHNGKALDNNDLQSKLKALSKVIWYEVENATDSIELFTRLNVGKIPLTSAELIKALFLSELAFTDVSPDLALRRKLDISQQWDEIEQHLNEKDEKFWSFITNEDRNAFETKIDLLFNLIPETNDRKDSLSTFLHFSKLATDCKPLWKIWITIQQYYLTLCEWYKDKDLYHKTGYLIATGSKLKDLLELSLTSTKTEFAKSIDSLIKDRFKAITSEKPLEALNYQDNYNLLSNLFLLLNTESIRQNENVTEFYSFKAQKGKKWSLEHIHAQNSEGLSETQKEPWLEWLREHKKIIEDYIATGTSEKREELQKLYEEVKTLEAQGQGIKGDKFRLLFNKVIQFFSDANEGVALEMHGVSNLALLGQKENSGLNSSVFEIKRRMIISMDKRGDYIPICTKRVFMKYYTDQSTPRHNYFWSKEDRAGYLSEIKKVLGHYLPTSINS